MSEEDPYLGYGGRAYSRPALLRVPGVNRRDPKRVPAVDWTGIQYKAVEDLEQQNPDHRGRLSSVSDVPDVTPLPGVDPWTL